MKTRYTLLAAALIGCGALTEPAQAQSMPELKFGGFGTLSAVHLSDRNADFVGGIFQPNGAGHTSSTSLNPDSKLGAQVSAIFSDKLSGVVQAVAQHQHDNSFTPQIEWANLKYQVLPELSVRAGRIAVPTFLLSESRFVGYGSPWVRPPVEVYGAVPPTSSDGVDATWRSPVAGASNAVQAFVGRTKLKLPGGNSAIAKSYWGITDTLEIGDLTLRAGFNKVALNFNVEAFQSLLDLATQFGLPEIAEKYKLTGMQSHALTLAFNYDPGKWFVMGEFVNFQSRGFLSNSIAWYASAGYRFGSLTPYVTQSSLKASVQPETGAGPLNPVFTGVSFAFNPTQRTSSLGLRWDAMKNVALKAQYDRTTTGSQSSGHLIAYPGFVQGSSVNLMTVSVDYLF